MDLPGERSARGAHQKKLFKVLRERVEVPGHFRVFGPAAMAGKEALRAEVPTNVQENLPDDLSRDQYPLQPLNQRHSPDRQNPLQFPFTEHNVE